MRSEERKASLRDAQRKLREERKAMGFKRIDFWVHEDDLGRVKQYENKLYNTRMREYNKKHGILV